MNLGTLASRLKREIQRSPKKAAVLGLLAIVAIWFWAPLMKNWFGGESDSPPQVVTAPDASASTEVLTSTPLHEAASTEKATANRRPWSELLDWMNEERLTRPATLAASQVDPFGRLRSQRQGGAKTDEEKVQRELRDVDPRRLGLVLHSTFIGPASRLASINGHICPLDAEIIVTPSGLTVREPRQGTDGSPEPVEDQDESRDYAGLGREHPTSTETVIGYQLTEIQSTHITLSRGTKSYRIDLKKFEINGGARASVTREQRRDG